MVLSSDKLSGLRQPLVMLKLDTVDILGKQEDKIVELTLDDVTNLLATLKSAQQV